MAYIKTITLDFCTVSLRNDGIIENRFLWDTPYEIDSEQLTVINKSIERLFDGKRRAILTIAGLHGSMTSEAREVDVKKSTEHTIAMGLVVQGVSQRMLARFYFRIKRVAYPVKFFKKEEEAVIWLHQQVALEEM